MSLYNDALDDVPAMAESNGFTGADFALRADALPPDMISAGENVYADETGHLVTRPGLRWVGVCHEGAVTTSTAVQGLAYYDTPHIETLVLVRDGIAYEVDSDQPGATSAVLAGVTPALSTTAPVRLAQLVDRLFCTDGTLNLRWSLHASGVWTHGNVAQLSDAGGAPSGPMPAWGGIVAHRMRLFAWPADGSRLYASAIGQAHGVADWRATDNLRFGIGEGDPIVAAISAQSGNLLVFTRAAVYAVDTTAAAVAAWTITKVTELAGCAAPRSVVAIGQDVLFLSRYGVVALGGLTDNISINPAATISAPMQSILDRINWSAREAIHATVWRDLYLLALPLDGAEVATCWLPFNVRTRRWAAPWVSTLGDLLFGTYAGAVLRTEDGALLVTGTPQALIDSGVAPGAITALLSTGWSAAVITHFDGQRETLVADDAGRLLRLDATHEKDDPAPDFSQDVPSWATLKAHDFATPLNPKQPFSLEVLFWESTATGVRLAYVPDGDLAYPDVPLADLLLIASGIVSGSFGVFPLIFPLVFRRNDMTRKRYHLRSLPRFHAAAIQIHAARGRLRLRSVRLSAFVDTPPIV